MYQAPDLQMGEATALGKILRHTGGETVGCWERVKQWCALWKAAAVGWWGGGGLLGKKPLSLFGMIFLGGKDLWLPIQNICLQSILKGITAADFCCDGGCREYQPDSYLWVNEQVEREYIINDNHLDQNIKKPLRAESTRVPCHHFDSNQVLRWDCLQQETKRWSEHIKTLWQENSNCWICV